MVDSARPRRRGDVRSDIRFLTGIFLHLSPDSREERHGGRLDAQRVGAEAGRDETIPKLLEKDFFFMSQKPPERHYRVRIRTLIEH